MDVGVPTSSPSQLTEGWFCGECNREGNAWEYWHRESVTNRPVTKRRSQRVSDEAGDTRSPFDGQFASLLRIFVPPLDGYGDPSLAPLLPIGEIPQP